MDPDAAVDVAPGAVEKPLPTVEETNKALESISPHRDPAAAAALRALAEDLIRVVGEHDRTTNVSEFLISLQIVCEGPANFQLMIQDRNTAVNPEALVQEILDNTRNEYGKPLRTIQLGFGDNEHAKRPTPAGEPGGGQDAPSGPA